MRVDVIVLDFVHKHMYIFCFGVHGYVPEITV